MSEGTDWNAVRFDPKARRGHAESYFLKANDPSGDRALWLKATIFAAATEPGRAVAEGWAIAFDRRGGTAKHVAVKHTVPFDDASFADHGLAIRWRARPSSGADSTEGVEILPGSTRGE